MFYLTRTILVAVCLTGLLSSFVTAQTKTKSQKTAPKSLIKIAAKVSQKYPNELSDYRFFEMAKWKSLEPLVSTMADVRKLLGDPSEANNVSQFTKPYPGDETAKYPVFTYDIDPDWEILVYFVKYCFQGYVPLPDSLDNKLCSVDLIPKKWVPFQNTIFPSVFKEKSVKAIDGAWKEYADGSGLVYEVYTIPGPYSTKKSGDMFRIVYTASDETFEKRAGKRSK